MFVDFLKNAIELVWQNFNSVFEHLLVNDKFLTFWITDIHPVPLNLYHSRSELADTILSVHPSDVLDMPVDPNEPTYCLCHQVSYGEMIGCDNPDVSIEIHRSMTNAIHLYYEFKFAV